MAWFDYLHAVSEGLVTKYGEDQPLAIIDESGGIITYPHFKQITESGRHNQLTPDSQYAFLSKSNFVDAWGYHFDRGDFR